MKATLKTVFALMAIALFTQCRIPIPTPTTTVPEEDTTHPEIFTAQFSVLGVNGQVFDLNETSNVGRIAVNQAISITVNARDRESGIQSVRISAPFKFYCGSTGFGPELTGNINSSNSVGGAGIGDEVRIGAGTSKIFSIRDVYEAGGCRDFTPRPGRGFPPIEATIRVTATNFKGMTTTQEFPLRIRPSSTEVTVLD